MSHSLAGLRTKALVEGAKGISRLLHTLAG